MGFASAMACGTRGELSYPASRGSCSSPSQPNPAIGMHTPVGHWPSVDIIGAWDRKKPHGHQSLHEIVVRGHLFLVLLASGPGGGRALEGGELGALGLLLLEQLALALDLGLPLCVLVFNLAHHCIHIARGRTVLPLAVVAGVLAQPQGLADLLAVGRPVAVLDLAHDLLQGANAGVGAADKDGGLLAQGDDVEGLRADEEGEDNKPPGRVPGAGSGGGRGPRGEEVLGQLAGPPRGREDARDERLQRQLAGAGVIISVPGEGRSGAAAAAGERRRQAAMHLTERPAMVFKTPPRTAKPSPLGFFSPTSPSARPSSSFRPQQLQYSPGRNSTANSTTTSNNGFSGGQRKATPNAMNQLTQPQIQELRESFQVLDKDGDGVISKDDLAAMLNSLGQEPTPTLLATYFSNVPTPFNLASYLTTLTTHLSALSPRDDILAAFAAFDDNDDGVINLDLLKDALADMGMREDEVEKACRGWTNKKGLGMGGDKFRYREYVDTVCGKAEAQE
ncbi:Calmodulin [Drechslerella dactyloides]|uniref:Calmodulin n=1 Tax=Drechslerella dactyloides TaxID=74499 RepID=A0AAD6IY67_DREDA|nr:Calmodulin [Drechslerella dactyloides]